MTQPPPTDDIDDATSLGSQWNGVSRETASVPDPGGQDEARHDEARQTWAAALGDDSRAGDRPADVVTADLSAAAVSAEPGDSERTGSERTDSDVQLPEQLAARSDTGFGGGSERESAADAADSANPPVPSGEVHDAVVPAGPLDVSRETTVRDAFPVQDAFSADTPIAREAQHAVEVLNIRQEVWPRPAAPRVITVANQKGGVGKTTTAVNIAAALALHGLQVVVLDLDPQGNASTALGIDHPVGTPSVYDVLLGDRPLGEVMHVAEFADTLRCVPATLDLAGADIELTSLVAREYRLQRAVAAFLQQPDPPDYLIIDCPPSLGLLTLNALVAAKEVLIPIQCEYYALEGLAQLLNTVELVRAHLNPELAVSTVLLTMYDGRTRLADQVADEVRRHFGDVVLAPVIPRNVRVSEAPGFGQTVITYDPGSRGAISYVGAARELAERGRPAAGDAQGGDDA